MKYPLYSFCVSFILRTGFTLHMCVEFSRVNVCQSPFFLLLGSIVGLPFYGNWGFLYSRFLLTASFCLCVVFFHSSPFVIFQKPSSSLFVPAMIYISHRSRMFSCFFLFFRFFSGPKKFVIVTFVIIRKSI